MVRRTVLLGHLGDVCMLTHVSRLNPGRIELFTRPEFVAFTAEFGRFAHVAPIKRLEQDRHEVIDLHTTSSRDPEYRQLMRTRHGTVAATHERLTWLSLPGRELPRRNYKGQSMSAYWQQLLGLTHGFPHEIQSSPVRARCITRSSPCRTLLSFQATTRHKSLSGPTAMAVVEALTRGTSHRLTIVEGPGPPAGGLADFDTVPVRSPEEFIQLAGDHCCLVSVDSGLRHLASLVDLPRIVVYGPTLPRICGSGFGELPILPTARCRGCGDPFSCASEQPFICLEEPSQFTERIIAKWATIHSHQ